MRIGLVDVDHGKYPNVALMKISAYHKNHGDEVEWAGGLFQYDKVYMAKVFTFTKDDDTAYQANEIIRGGTGYDLKSKLPDEIEHTMPDYSLYGITDHAYGYLTRGCPRGCPFCIVKDKEGRQSYKVADLNEWWNGQKKIDLLDPNILASPDCLELLGQLAESKAIINYNQGLDIRMMTDEKLEAINKTRYSDIHFAWDNPDDPYAPAALKKFAGRFKKKHGHGPVVYCLTNFGSTHEQDLYRVEWLRALDYDPYIMIYDKWNAPRITRLLQRYVNNKVIFHTVKSFAEYDQTKG